MIISMGKSKERTRNEQRSDVKNPTSKDYKANRDNRANQKNDNHKKSKG